MRRGSTPTPRIKRKIYPKNHTNPKWEQILAETDCLPSPSPPKSKKSLIAAVVVIAVVAISVFLVYRQMNTGTFTLPTPTSKIDHIDYFLVSDKGTVVQVQFALMSSDLESVSADGTVYLAINDSSTAHSLYETTFTIYKSNFGYYQTAFGKTILAYQWSIPISSIQKCISYATARLTFRITDGSSWSETQEYITLPKYTEDELKQMYENRYLQSAKVVGQTVTSTNFAITLVRMGSFTHLKYDTFGDEVTQFRIDFKVASLSPEPEYLFESNIVIVDNLANQYNYEYGGTLDLGEIYPGVIKQGYVLFPSLNENASTIKITVKEIAYPEDIMYEFNVSV